MILFLLFTDLLLVVDCSSFSRSGAEVHQSHIFSGVHTMNLILVIIVKSARIPEYALVAKLRSKTMLSR
jgi:hypothetical protein